MPRAVSESSQRARAELLAGPERTDAEIAALAGLSPSQVANARSRLVLAGLIQRKRQVVPRPPCLPRLPPMPAQLARGQCARPGANPDLWTSQSPADREVAIAICRRCPVREPCASWALTLPLADSAVYGAMTASERRRARQQLAAAS